MTTAVLDTKIGEYDSADGTWIGIILSRAQIRVQTIARGGAGAG